MKNKIVYGMAASGKTENYFKPEIKSWKGKTIAVCFKKAVDFKNEEIKEFKIFDLDNSDASFDEIFSYTKILLQASTKNIFEYKSNGFKNIVTYLIENNKKFKEPVLFAVDDLSGFVQYNGDESLMLNLLKLDKINTLFITQSLKDLKTIFKDDYEDIIKLSDVICTKENEEYSGELRVRFPKSLHRYLKEESDKEGISLNQYIVYELTKSMK